MEKQNQTQQKYTFTNQNKCSTTKNNLKPGLVASYDTQPWNREGLFWFWHFINLSVTYLDTHLLTAQEPHGAPRKELQKAMKTTMLTRNKEMLTLCCLR